MSDQQVSNRTAAQAARLAVTHKQFLNGPNRYSDHSLLLLGLDLGSLAASLSAPLRPGLGGLDALRTIERGRAIVELIERARGGSDEPGPLDMAVTLTALLQEQYVLRSGRGRASGDPAREITVLLPAEDEAIGLAAWDLAITIVAGIQNDGQSAAAPADLIQQREQFTRLGRRLALDQLTLAMVRRAAELDIPYYWTDRSMRVVQLGQGRWRKRAFETHAETNAHFAGLYTSKTATGLRLRELGLPVLPSFQVGSADDAVAAAARIKAPVVLKPARGGKGRGVSIDLSGEAEIREAYRVAAALEPEVLVERFAPGDDHRLLVVGGKLVAAARRMPAIAIGDGTRTVAALIDQLNADPRRGDPYDSLMERIVIDSRLHAVLAKQGLDLDAVPEAGQVVRLSLAANISQGGTSIDVLPTIHPDNREAVERAALGLGIDITGIDFITSDISRSWREVGGWILEANLSPGLRPHWLANPAQDVVTPILRRNFPEGAQARIPTVGVTGSLGKTTTCQMVSHIAGQGGLRAGLTTTQGIWSGRYRVAQGDSAVGKAAERALTDPTNDLGVFEFARGALLRSGMYIDGVDVAAVLNLHENHVGSEGITSREQLAEVKSIIVRTARRWAVLNADEPLVLAMAERTKTARIALVSTDPNNRAIAAHQAQGHCTVTVEDGAIRLFDKRQEQLCITIADIPAALGGQARAIVANAAFAVAIAYALNLPGDVIAAGLSTFSSDIMQNPGRHNRIPGPPCDLVLHWADGAVALGDMVGTLSTERPAGKRQLFLTSPGNRDDGWITELGRVAAGHFDRYYCADLKDLRGRAAGEVPSLLRDGLLASGVAEDRIVTAATLTEAMRAANPDDLLAVVTYETGDALQQIAACKVAQA